MTQRAELSGLMDVRRSGEAVVSQMLATQGPAVSDSLFGEE